MYCAAFETKLVFPCLQTSLLASLLFTILWTTWSYKTRKLFSPVDFCFFVTQGDRQVCRSFDDVMLTTLLWKKKTERFAEKLSKNYAIWPDTLNPFPYVNLLWVSRVLRRIETLNLYRYERNACFIMFKDLKIGEKEKKVQRSVTSLTFPRLKYELTRRKTIRNEFLCHQRYTSTKYVKWQAIWIFQ